MGGVQSMTETDHHWFEDVADFLGPAYLRYSFTKGTKREVESLIDLLSITPGDRVLDIGCGPGRHSLELAGRGFEVVGIDVSESFIDLARSQAEKLGLTGKAQFEVINAKNGSWDREFDGVISLCQGAFGLSGGTSGVETIPSCVELDEPILSVMARALVDGGRLALTGFSSYFQVRYLEDSDTFEPLHGVNHENTVLTDENGDTRQSELWTTCFTPRELRLLARAVGLTPIDVHGVTPGRYEPGAVTLDMPELLLVAKRVISGG